jgi:hypothetical protein
VISVRTRTHVNDAPVNVLIKTEDCLKLEIRIYSLQFRTSEALAISRKGGAATNIFAAPNLIYITVSCDNIQQLHMSKITFKEPDTTTH